MDSPSLLVPHLRNQRLFSWNRPVSRPSCRSLGDPRWLYHRHPDAPMEGGLKRTPLKNLVGSLIGLVLGMIVANLISNVFFSHLLNHQQITLPLFGGTLRSLRIYRPPDGFQKGRGNSIFRMESLFEKPLREGKAQRSSIPVSSSMAASQILRRQGFWKDLS